MKLLKLQVEKIRGIKDINFSPYGNNFVVWGPNGSGKSALIDAIDFLLTGRVSRLTGEGTGDITLNKHGPHIDHTPKEAKVSADVKLTNSDTTIKITRCMANPTKLDIDSSNNEAIRKVSEIESIAKRGQHVLTRREILKFITAEGSTRAQEIQSLLNIIDIENVRKSLVKVRGIFEREVISTKKQLEEAQSQINVTLQKSKFSEKEILKEINHNRKILGGEPVESIDLNEIKKELPHLTATAKGAIANINIFERDIENVKTLLNEENKVNIEDNNKKLKSALNKIISDPILLKSLNQKTLLDLGIKLIDESGNCPLCDTAWAEGELEEYLTTKIEKAKLAEKYQNELNPSISILKEHFNNLSATISRVTAVIKKFKDLGDKLKLFESWQEKIQEYLSLFEDIYTKYTKSKIKDDEIKCLFSPLEFESDIDDILEHIQSKLPKSSPEQTAWDLLTRLEENIKSLNKTNNIFVHNVEAFNRADLLLNSFQKARDDVLTNLYNDIRDRFVELYRELHREDEDNFKAEIKPDGASLKFEVEFHGRGHHPPHALHSEGHQDSMGLCLYLALNEKLTHGFIDLILLDDVVMSVDSSHRKSLCSLLSKFFKDRQLFITTHDKTWSNQLRAEGVVNNKNRVEFYNWNLETGPQLNYEIEMWDRIYSDIAKNDISNASAKLRKGLEEYFCMICDSLRASIPFRMQGNYELNDYLTGALSRYNKLLKSAKSSAKSWDNYELYELLNEVESTSSQIFKRVGGEQWAINVNVHYNTWANFIGADFKEVTDAFQDLFAVFTCNKCDGIIKLIRSGVVNESLKCNCGKINWNLKLKN